MNTRSKPVNPAALAGSRVARVFCLVCLALPLMVQARSVSLTVKPAIEGRSLQIQGAIDAPDQTIVDWQVHAAEAPRTGVPHERVESGACVVRDGRFSAVTDLSSWPAGVLVVSVSMHPPAINTAQPEAAARMSGERGEFLQGGNVKLAPNGVRYVLVAATVYLPGGEGGRALSRRHEPPVVVNTRRHRASVAEPPADLPDPEPAETPRPQAYAAPEPASHPVEAVSPPQNELPTGTILSVSLLDEIDLSRHNIGRLVRASVDQPVRVRGSVLVPRGADAVLRVISNPPATRTSGTPVILSLSAVRIRGAMVEISSAPLGAVASGNSRKKGGSSPLRTLGLAVAAGAASGAVMAGAPGAAIGAAAGLGGESARRLLHRKPARLTVESKLKFRILEPGSTAGEEGMDTTDQ